MISEVYREAERGEWIGVSCNFRRRSIADERCRDGHEFRGNLMGFEGYTSKGEARRASKTLERDEGNFRNNNQFQRKKLDLQDTRTISDFAK